MSEIFENWITGPADMSDWAVNVVEKLQGFGIIPTYIERSEDFEELFGAISIFFAEFVIGAREFESFSLKEDFLKAFLTQRGLILNDQGIELATLQHLQENYYAEIRKRGTLQCLGTSDLAITYGELSRLLNKWEKDEYLYNILAFPYVGWVLGVTSPMNRQSPWLFLNNKAYDSGRDADLIFDHLSGNGTFGFIVDGTKTVLSIGSVSVGDEAGLITEVMITSNLIVVNPVISYEITFFIRQLDANAKVKFACLGLDGNGVGVDLKDPYTNSVTSIFVENYKFALSSEYYFVRGILYSKDFIATPRETLNIGVGNNLQLQTGVVYIDPILTLTGDGSSVNEIRIWDFKIRPLESLTSKGFLSPSKFIEFWLKNNNYNLQEIVEGDLKKIYELERYMRRYLMPYDIDIVTKFL